ncbi:MAG: hypothetical protein PWQ85_868 [Geotoga sp.]|nr:hypothetical protein [Geotoga sp.]
MKIIWSGKDLNEAVPAVLENKGAEGMFALLRKGVDDFYAVIVDKETWRREIKGYTMLAIFYTNLPENILEKQVKMMAILAKPRKE